MTNGQVKETPFDWSKGIRVKNLGVFTDKIVDVKGLFKVNEHGIFRIVPSIYVPRDLIVQDYEREVICY
jgi:hypothetical protein